MRGRQAGEALGVHLPVVRAATDGGDTLNRDEKAAAIAELAERLRDRDTILAADFRGLSVKEMAAFRGRLREAEAEFTVVKNTLARRAAADADREALLPLLNGPCGLVWTGPDAAAAAKALKDFGDEHDGRPAITGGLLEGEEIDVAGITRLAKLPGREQLLANMASGLLSPISGLAGGLDSLLSGLARTLGQVAAQREGEAPADAPAET